MKYSHLTSLSASDTIRVVDSLTSVRVMQSYDIMLQALGAYDVVYKGSQDLRTYSVQCLIPNDQKIDIVALEETLQRNMSVFTGPGTGDMRVSVKPTDDGPISLRLMLVLGKDADVHAHEEFFRFGEGAMFLGSNATVESRDHLTADSPMFATTEDILSDLGDCVVVYDDESDHHIVARNASTYPSDKIQTPKEPHMTEASYSDDIYVHNAVYGTVAGVRINSLGNREFVLKELSYSMVFNVNDRGFNRDATAIADVLLEKVKASSDWCSLVFTTHCVSGTELKEHEFYIKGDAVTLTKDLETEFNVNSARDLIQAMRAVGRYPHEGDYTMCVDMEASHAILFNPNASALHQISSPTAQDFSEMHESCSGLDDVGVENIGSVLATVPGLGSYGSVTVWPISEEFLSGVLSDTTHNSHAWKCHEGPTKCKLAFESLARVITLFNGGTPALTCIATDGGSGNLDIGSTPGSNSSIDQSSMRYDTLDRLIVSSSMRLSIALEEELDNCVYNGKSSLISYRVGSFSPGPSSYRTYVLDIPIECTRVINYTSDGVSLSVLLVPEDCEDFKIDATSAEFDATLKSLGIESDSPLASYARMLTEADADSSYGDIRDKVTPMSVIRDYFNSTDDSSLKSLVDGITLRECNDNGAVPESSFLEVLETVMGSSEYPGLFDLLRIEKGRDTHVSELVRITI